MIRCIAIDDEPMALEKLKNYIERIPFLELVAACSCTCDAMQVMAEQKVDALFIDINMPGMNGMDFVKSLPEHLLVVFTTAYSEYAADSYKVRAVDFLLKPFSFVDFQRSAGYMLQQYENMNREVPASSENDGHLFLKVDYRYVRVNLDDIIYIEGMNEYLKVHLHKADPLLVHTTFKNMNGHLPGYFLQMHRSYVINMKNVLEIERSVILLKGGKRISISDSNKETVTNYLNRYLVKK